MTGDAEIRYFIQTERTRRSVSGANNTAAATGNLLTSVTEIAGLK